MFLASNGELGLLPASSVKAYAFGRAKMNANKIPAKIKNAINEADKMIAKREQNQSFVSQENEAAIDFTTNTELENSQSSDSYKKTFGIIGLGNLTQIMLGKFLSSGHNCIIWDIELAKGNIHNPLDQAVVAQSPGDVIRKADVTFCYMDNDEKANMMVNGIDGVLESMNSSKSYVEMSQIDQATSMQISEKIKRKGGRYLEAQTVYFPGMLEKVQGVTFSAGDSSLSDECMSVFSFFSSNVYYFGQVGVASLNKILISSLCNSMATAIEESFSLSHRYGLDLDVFAETAKMCLSQQVEPIIDLLLAGHEVPKKKMIQEQQHSQKVALSAGLHTPVLSATTQSLLSKMEQ